MDVIWLTGPSGVGKSTIGWQLHRRLPDAVFVDADQLGLCYPAPDDDPGNHRIKARNVAALRLPDAPLIVAGIVDDTATWRLYRAALGTRRVVVCRLRVEPVELRSRIAARGGPRARFADAAVEHAAQLDRTDFADVVVETTGLSQDVVVELVGRRTGLVAA